MEAAIEELAVAQHTQHAGARGGVARRPFAHAEPGRERARRGGASLDLRDQVQRAPGHTGKIERAPRWWLGQLELLQLREFCSFALEDSVQEAHDYDAASVEVSRHCCSLRRAFPESMASAACCAACFGSSRWATTSAAAAFNTNASREGCVAPDSTCSRILALSLASPPAMAPAAERLRPKSSGVTILSLNLPSLSSVMRVGPNGLSSSRPSSLCTTQARLLPSASNVSAK